MCHDVALGACVALSGGWVGALRIAGSDQYIAHLLYRWEQLRENHFASRRYLPETKLPLWDRRRSKLAPTPKTKLRDDIPEANFALLRKFQANILNFVQHWWYSSKPLSILFEMVAVTLADRFLHKFLRFSLQQFIRSLYFHYFPKLHKYFNYLIWDEMSDYKSQVQNAAMVFSWIATIECGFIKFSQPISIKKLLNSSAI